MSEKLNTRFDLKHIEKLLKKDVEENRNFAEIALDLNIVRLLELERRAERGIFNIVDQRRKLSMGQIIVPIAIGQSVLQAIEIGLEY